MATVRLDYDDAYQTQFDAVILDLTEMDGRPAIVLDQTCFYPTSGGQSHDTGLLGGQRVLYVAIDDHGNVLHYLDVLPDGAKIGARLGTEGGLACLKNSLLAISRLWNRAAERNSLRSFNAFKPRFSRSAFTRCRKARSMTLSKRSLPGGSFKLALPFST